MIKLRSILILLCTWISVQSNAQISTDTFYVSQDSYVNSGSPTSTYETDTSLYIYQDTGATVKVYRSFLQFDVSSIPSNAIIVSATLRLTKHSTVDSLDHDIYIERMDSIWYDDSITWNNQSGAYLSDQLSFTDAETSGASPHEFDVTDHVEHFVWYQHLNNGWRIRLQDESDTSDYGMIYYSSDHDTAEWRPHLEVQYIMPLDITVNTKHCTNGNNDGSFELELTGGSQGPLDYFWLYSYDGTVATSIDQGYDPTIEDIENDTLSPGLYLLSLRDSLWNVYPENKFTRFYKWFIIGEEGETHSIDWYRQSEWYHNDVAIARSTQTTNNPNWHDNNYDNEHHIGTGYTLPTPTFGYDMAGLIQYQMDFDPSLEFDTAQLILNKHGSYYRNAGGSNAVYFRRATSWWDDKITTWNTRPTVDSTYVDTLAQTEPAGYHYDADTIDMTNNVEYWQYNQELNYGLEFAVEFGQTTGNTRFWRGGKFGSPTGPRLKLSWSVKPPLSIDGVVHHCTNGNDDGEIEVSVYESQYVVDEYKWLKLSGGSYTLVEQGTDLENADIDSLEDGLYMFYILENSVVLDYKYFLVGEEGVITDVEVYFSNMVMSPQFGDDAHLVHTIATGDSSQTGGAATSIIAANNSTYDSRGLLKNKLDFAQELEFLQANQILTSKGHYQNASTDNSAWFSMVLEDWDEDEVTWANRPSVSEVYRIEIPETQTIGYEYGSDTLNVLEFVEYWQEYPDSNFGYELSLQDYDQTGTASMHYSSSDQPNGPKLLLSFTTKPPPSIDGVVHHCTNGNDDGEIEVSVYEGKYVIDSYKWHQLDSGTVSLIEQGSDLDSAAVDSLENGLYVFSVYEGAVLVEYKYFLVGEEGQETTVQFHDANTNAQFSSEHNEDAIMRYYYLTEDGSANNDDDNTLSAYSSFSSKFYEASLLKYKVDFQPELDFTSSSLYMESDGTGGHYRQDASVSNAGYISRVSSGWEEEVVTWDSRPSIDSTMQITIPETGTTGFVVRNDTFDLSGFVDYWQEHPDENFGIELSLQDYSQGSKTFRLLYRSSDVGGTDQRPIFELKFNLKPPISSYFDVSTKSGIIEVNAPKTGELPYKYLIGYDPLPVLDSLWNDSLGIDSLSFFRGDVNSANFIFSNLPAEKYFIGVYDNSGAKIADYEVGLNPQIQLFEGEDLVIEGNNIEVATGYPSAAGSINGSIQKYGSGGIDFVIDAIDNYSLGFNAISHQLSSVASDLEYGLSFDATRTFNLISGSQTLYTGTYDEGDNFRFVKENYEIVCYQNKVEVYRGLIDANSLEDYKVDILLNGQFATLSKAILLGQLPYSLIRPADLKVFNTECGLDNGKIIVTANPNFPNIANWTTNVTVTEINTNDTYNFVINPQTSHPLNLPVGEYQITYSATDGSNVQNWTSNFTIGQTIEWNLLNAYFTAINGPTNTIQSSSICLEGEALSQNQLPAADDGWVSFEANAYNYFGFVACYPQTPAFSHATVSLMNDLNQDQVKLRMVHPNFNVINKFIYVYDYTGALMTGSFSSYSTGPFKINVTKGTSNTYDVYFQNAISPFSTATGPTGSDLRVYATSRGGEISETYASFCKGLTTSELCAHLDYELDGNYYVTNNGKFCFVYNEEYNDPNIEFNIYSQAGSIVATQNDFNMPPLIHGENRVVLDFTSNGHCIGGSSFFILEVINDKKEKFYLRFYNLYSACGLPYEEDNGGGNSF